MGKDLNCCAEAVEDHVTHLLNQAQKIPARSSKPKFATNNEDQRELVVIGSIEMFRRDSENQYRTSTTSKRTT